MAGNYQDYRTMARDVSSRGRYGDTMLMHVNPLEVEALNQAFPGSITTNPDTGQPEAFWFLLPLLSTLATGLGAVGPGITSALGGGSLASGVGGILGAIPSLAGTALGGATGLASNLLPGFLGGAGGATGIGGSSVPGWLGGGTAGLAPGAELGALSSTAIPSGSGLEGISGLHWGATNPTTGLSSASTTGVAPIAAPPTPSVFGMDVSSLGQGAPGGIADVPLVGDALQLGSEELLQPAMKGLGTFAMENPGTTALVGYGAIDALANRDDEGIEPEDPGYGSYVDEEGNPIPSSWASRELNRGAPVPGGDPRGDPTRILDPEDPYYGQYYRYG